MYYNINSLIIFLKREILVITFYRNKSGQQCYRQEETGGGMLSENRTMSQKSMTGVCSLIISFKC